MTTKAQIFNQALYKAKRDRITNPSQAVELNDIYDDIRDATLWDHPWNFAIEYKQVARDESTTNWKFAYAYTLPVNPYCLRVWRLEDADAVWEVTGRKLVTDLGSPLNIVYIKRVTDESHFSPGFVSALACRLAYEAGAKLGLDRAERKSLLDEYQGKIGLGRSGDGQEGGISEFEVDEYLEARL